MTGKRSRGPSPAAAPRPVRRHGTHPVIDFHAHIMVREVADVVTASRPPESPECRLVAGFRKGARAHRRAHPTPGARGLQARLQDMDRLGIDIQVISCHVAQFCYWADAQQGLALARITNERTAEFVAQRPERFVGLGMVPLQEVGLAVGELERAVGELGLRGVEIGTQVEGTELGDARLEPFWTRAEQLGVAVLVHPAGFVHPRFRRHELWNGLGQPLEEALALASLLYDGVLDRHPALRLCIVHGGGFLPFYTGRVDRNFAKRPKAFPNLQRPPSDYLRQVHYDTAFYDVGMLEFLVRKVGAERVVMGADYPIGEADPVAFVRSAKGLSAADRRAILGGNAARLLDLAA